MNRRTLTVLSVSAIGLVTYLVINSKAQVECKRAQVTCTTLQGDEYRQMMLPVWNCPRIGVVLQDGGTMGDEWMGCRVENCEEGRCAKEPNETEFECAFRPKGAPVESCMRKAPAKGVNGTKDPYDFGDNNVIPAGEWIGDGCERCPCVEVAGVPWKKRE